jgi:hypothetical protein
MFRDRNAEAAVVPVVPCEDGFPEYNRLVWKWSQHESGIEREDQRMLNNTHRLIQHLRYEEIPRLHTTLDNRKWGVEYLRHHVTREEWGQKLYVAYRKKEREQRRVDILGMFVMVSCDLYRNWYHDALTGPEMLESLHKVFAYTNENILVYNQQYGTKAAFLDPSVPIDQHILEYHHPRVPS